MAKLILSLDGMVIREYPLTKERTTLGRKPHNDIVIDNLAISGEHAMIMTILNDSFLEDLGSTNGTLVNGQPIKKHFLQNNDVVELGKYKLKYVTEATLAQTSPADFEKTMVLRAPAGGAKAEQGKVEAAPAAAKSFGDTVVNPEMMQTQGPGLREAARQAVAVGESAAAPVGRPLLPQLVLLQSRRWPSLWRRPLLHWLAPRLPREQPRHPVSHRTCRALYRSYPVRVQARSCRYPNP